MIRRSRLVYVAAALATAVAALGGGCSAGDLFGSTNQAPPNFTINMPSAAAPDNSGLYVMVVLGWGGAAALFVIAAILAGVLIHQHTQRKQRGHVADAILEDLAQVHPALAHHFRRHLPSYEAGVRPELPAQRRQAIR